MSRPIRVLYVDGDPATMDRIDRLPEPDGTPVESLTERTAESGLKRIVDGAVDCVVSEFDLPDGTGLELLRDVREYDPDLPVVLFTTRPLAEFAEAAVSADLSEYLRRTPDADQHEELGDRIRSAVDGRRSASIEDSQRFRSIIEQSSDVVSILDDDATYLYQSPSVEEVLGYDPERFEDATVFDFVHPDDEDRVRTELYAAIEDPERTPTLEYRLRHADGSWRVVESRGTNMFDDPVVGGFVVNTRDVTERRRREQRTNVLNRTLRHDLRNSMNVILGNAELLMREYGNDDRAETVRKTAAEMLDLSNKVRDIEEALDTSDDPREMVDLVSVVEEYLSAVRRSRPDVEVESDLPESEWVLANNQIGTAVDNAIENALEHNDADTPRLRVWIEETDLGGEDAVAVTVADNGPGIPDEELDVVTQGGETPLEHASGLGLWLIKWIVDQSGGDIRFEESDMDGTAVRMTLKQASVGQRIDTV